MEISKALADKLVRLAKGERLPASSMRSRLVSDLIIEGIIIDQRIGRNRSMLYVADVDALKGFLRNHFSIQDIESYATVLKRSGSSRAELTRCSSDSKLIPVRTFKGFLVNSFMPIRAMLDNKEIIIHPISGTFQFIHNYETFIPATEVVIVNVENSENFSRIAHQQFLFEGMSVLFVSRYPQNQSKDLLKWLQSIPNNYLHYGDFDYAGINIYINEYKRELGERAKFFIPDNLELLLSSYGSKALYDRQNLNVDVGEIKETGVIDLIRLIQLYKKGLEQEVLIDLV
ncbi:DUF7281 domain-containing protein [Sphingobacterium hotanense]|uniref:DUF7281 domain-containing protein n=1 Tax=Sphingobacterium hotanense TaxID=649196 RepID=UPI0011F1C2DD|nr:hypothetical protein [Sphingobacterium hotanense]